MSLQSVFSAMLHSRKVSTQTPDWALIPPRPEGSLMTRMVRPRVDGFHSERAPNGEVVEFTGGFAPGHHITHSLMGMGSRAWFDYDRIDSGAPLAPRRGHSPKVGCLSLCALPRPAEIELLYNDRVSEDDFRQVARAFDLAFPDHAFPSSDENHDLALDARIDLTMPELARGILQREGLEAADGTTLPPMSIVRKRRRRVKTVSCRVSDYLALDLCYVQMQTPMQSPPVESTLLTTLFRGAWHEAPRPQQGQNPHAFFLSQTDSHHGSTSLPVFMRVKAIRDNQLETRFFSRSALLPNIAIA